MSGDKLAAFADGMDTTRLPSTSVDGETERRDDTSRVARTKLAAFLVTERGGMAAVTADPELAAAAAADFADLIDMLGLALTPPAEPGICRRPGCDRALSISASAAHAAKQYRREGFCTPACWADTERPPGCCAVCGRGLSASDNIRRKSGRTDRCARQACRDEVDS
jgi:hypothetical protein